MKVALESTSQTGMPSVKTGLIIVVGTFCFPTATESWPSCHRSLGSM